MILPAADVGLMTASTPQARLGYILAHFGERSLVQLLTQHMPPAEELGELWRDRLHQLIEAGVCNYLHQRDASKGESGYRPLLDSMSLESLQSAPTTKVKSAALYIKALGSEKDHNLVLQLIPPLLSRIERRLEGEVQGGSQHHSERPGDVVLEGPGFEVAVGQANQRVLRYPEGKTGIILMHDPRDGHFLLTERFSDLTGGYLLELPKVVASSAMNRSVAASTALFEQTGLASRTLEKIGEVMPDSSLIDGICEVYYGNFDLEENFKPQSSRVRSLKRVNEEGIYQGAFEGRITCSLTLSALSIWHAFESVRKKRLANSRRIRTPKGAVVAADEDE